MRIYLVGTFDTKAEELGYLANAIVSAGGAPCRRDLMRDERLARLDRQCWNATAQRARDHAA